MKQVQMLRLALKLQARWWGPAAKVLALNTPDSHKFPLPIQLTACGLGKQSRTAQDFGTLHPRGRPRRGSWFPALDQHRTSVAVTWVVNHQTENLPLCLSSSLYIRFCNKKIYISFFKKGLKLDLRVEC